MTTFVWLILAVLLLSRHSKQQVSTPPFTTSGEERLRKDIIDSYVKEIRPSATTEVSVELNLITINDLDTKTQTFSATGYFRMQWNDSRLSWDENKYNGTDLMVSDEWSIWRPPVVISNEVSSVKIISDRAIPIRIKSSGLITWSPPMLMQTDCDLKVQYYPFDTQECSIEMTTWGYQLNEVNLLANRINMDDFNDNNEWDLVGHVIDRQEITRDGDNSDEVAKLTFTFTVARISTYYVLSEVVPTVLMSFLGPVVFMYPAEGGEKLSYAVTVFLAYAVFLTFISDQLPPSNTAPSILSVYLVAVTTIGALCVVLTIVILDIYHTDDHDNEVPLWLDKLTRATRFIMGKSCSKKPTDVGHSDDIPDKISKEKEEANKKMSWRKVAITLDMLCFRLAMLTTIILMIYVLVSLNGN